MVINLSKQSVGIARPFVKWAGGKTQLLNQLAQYLPRELYTGNIKRYIEPFVGGGALFFYIINNFDLEESFLIDVNEELILAYNTIQRHVDSLISSLHQMQFDYAKLRMEDRSKYFYDIRKRFNETKEDFNYTEYSEKWIDRTAEFLFLNRTCYNGLFRVNRKGQFNVPFGRYVNPCICPAENLISVSEALRKTKILKGDFSISQNLADKSTFIYCDPPYRPISKTASFTSYTECCFDDTEQLRLAGLFKQLDANGAKVLLSNSDPKNINPEDHFFEDVYNGFAIRRIKASRMINSNPDKRGIINEIIITNYWE